MSLHYGLRMSEFIDRLYYEDEFCVAMAYGGMAGTGKSAYCIKSVAEVLGSHPGFPENKPNYEAVKSFIVFPPKEWVDKLLSMKRREKVLIPDDMGLWLFALDWYNPFVKAVVKYLNVARTDWACIFGNTPSPRMIVSFVQSFPEIIRVKILKQASNVDHPSRPRIARGYQVWMTPDYKKSGVKRVFEDHYSAIMPDDFFSWYKPRRDYYANVAKQLMYTELMKLKARDKEEALEEGYKKVVPTPERIKELEEIVAQIS